MNWIKQLFRRREVYQDLSEEIQQHLDEKVDELVESGMSPDKARALARREFGNVTLLEQDSREVWRWSVVENLWRDVRYATRSLAHSPGLSAAVVITLALGIGANAAIFSVVDAVLLRSLPVPAPEELFVVSTRLDDSQFTAFSYPMFKDLEESVAEQAQLFAVGGADLEVTFVDESGQGTPERVRLDMVSGGFFPTLGVQPIIGRVLTQEDNRQRGQHPVAVISHRFWQGRFGSDPTAVGRGFVLNETIFTVVGVAAPRFYGVSPGTAADIWIPAVMQEQVNPGRSRLDTYGGLWLQVMGRRATGVEERAISTQLNFRFAQVQKRLAETRDAKSRALMMRMKVEVEPGQAGFDSLRQQYSQPLQFLLVVAALVLLIACANVANLLLARATARSRDAAVRRTLGAPRSLLIRQCLTESLLLAVLGGLAALGLAAVGSQALLALVSSGNDAVVLDVGMNWRLVGFAAAIALLAALLFGMAPALQGTRTDLRGSLSAIGPRATEDRGRSSLRNTLAVVQVTIAVVLVVCAGLFLRTIRNLHATEGGFDRENVLMVRIAPRSAGYVLPRGRNVSETERRTAEARLLGLLTRLINRLEAVPGVSAVTKSECGFLHGCNSARSGLIVDGGTPEPSDELIRYEQVWPSYVKTMGLTLLAGRDLSDRDGPEAPRVALINETMAQTYFGGTDALGRTFHWKNSPASTEVVGVVRDVKRRGPRSEVWPYIYYPHAQNPSGSASLMIRTSIPAASLVGPVRAAISDVESKINVFGIATLEQQFDDVIGRELLLARLTAAFGVLALALTCVGLYGLLAYSVVRRTNEIGLRMALGAQRRSIVTGILRKTLLLVAVGLGAGLALAVVAARLIESQLFEVAPSDPLTVGLAALVVLIVALLAAGLPAHRAARIEPMSALRYD